MFCTAFYVHQFCDRDFYRKMQEKSEIFTMETPIRVTTYKKKYFEKFLLLEMTIVEVSHAMYGVSL